MAGSRAVGDETPRPNLEIEQGLVQEIIARAVARMELPDSSILWLHELPNSSTWSWLIEQGLARHCAARRLQKGTAEQGDFPQLSYAPLTLSVQYTADRDQQGRAITRTITCAIHLRYETLSGMLQFAEDFKAEYSDSIDRASISRIENKAYAFTTGPHLPATLFHKVIEPILITLITGGIIYVFYSFRSH